MRAFVSIWILTAFLSAGMSATNSTPQLILAWDRSVDDWLTNGMTYVIHGEQRTATATNLITVAGITNNTVGIYDIISGDWSFYATAKQAGIESEPSNTLLIRVPVAPSNVKTVVLQYSANLNGPFADALFLKLKPIP